MDSDLPAFIRSLAPDAASAVQKAADLFDESPRAVKGWMYGERLPRPAKAAKLIERARQGGRKLTLSAIYRDRGHQ